MSHSGDMLVIEDLGVCYGSARVLHGVDLSVGKGEVVGIVGESGSGKSTLLKAVAGLLPKTARISSGSIDYDGLDIAALDEKRLRLLRGARIGFLFQDAAHSLDPLFSIRSQFDEAMRAHGRSSDGRSARAAVQKSALERVGLFDTERILRALPSELSGGMCQRVALAFALALGPDILLADEPTAALDGASRDRIVGILKSLNVESGLSILMVSHDIGLAGSLAGRIAVMRGGRIVETGPSERVIGEPHEPYTRELVDAIPRMTGEVAVRKLGGRHAS